MTMPSLATNVPGRGRHYPDRDGVLVPSITNVLSLIDKSGPLTWWAARTVTEHVADNLGEFVDTVMRASRDTTKRYEALKPTIGVFRKRTKDAADAGTSVHEWLELAITANDLVIAFDAGVVDEEEVDAAISALKKCEADLSADARRFLPAALEFMEKENPSGFTEQTVLGGIVGHTRYGGTLDLRGRVGGHVNVVCDFKTRGNNKHEVYETEALQLAAQRHGTLHAVSTEDGPQFFPQEKADGAVLVTFTPTNGYKVHPMTEVTGDETFEAFLSLVRSWRLFADVKDAVKGRVKA